MSHAARSMFVWTIYVAAIGAGMLLVPNTILGLFRIEETSEPWIRLVGILVIALGIIYAFMVRDEDRGGFEASVYARWFAAAGMTALAFTTGPWQLVLFASVDFAGALWTFLAVKRDAT